MFATKNHCARLTVTTNELACSHKPRYRKDNIFSVLWSYFIKTFNKYLIAPPVLIYFHM